MSPPTTQTPVRARFAETDAQGVVYHANYFVYFEIGRAEYLRERAFDYREMEAAGLGFVVAEAQARYRAPVRYDDELVVTTRVGEARNRSVTFEYEVRRGDTLVATGSTVHVCVDREGKAVRMPGTLRGALGVESP